jgi:hypothetical protein
MNIFRRTRETQNNAAQPERIPPNAYSQLVEALLLAYNETVREGKDPITLRTAENGLYDDYQNVAYALCERILRDTQTARFQGYSTEPVDETTWKKLQSLLPSENVGKDELTQTYGQMRRAIVHPIQKGGLVCAIARYNVDDSGYDWAMASRGDLRAVETLTPVEQLGYTLLEFCHETDSEKTVPGDPYAIGAMVARIPQIVKTLKAHFEASKVDVDNLDEAARAAHSDIETRIQEHATKQGDAVREAINNYRTLKSGHKAAISNIDEDMRQIRKEDKAQNQLSNAIGALASLEADLEEQPIRPIRIQNGQRAGEEETQALGY